ncbi:hypothetical protein, partial [Neisseria sicca]|uniref:hypothetical protein n=1 Tax=Neisseria sicca TaxID=490 RepID=UPI0011BD03B6
MAGVEGDVFAVQLEMEGFGFEKGEEEVLFAEGEFNERVGVVDVEGRVEVGVVNQSSPANRRGGF